jgi:hypothetical protein
MPIGSQLDNREWQKLVDRVKLLPVKEVIELNELEDLVSRFYISRSDVITLLKEAKEGKL